MLIFQGEIKQNLWVEQVQKAIKNVKNSELKQLLEKILSFHNIPRKEIKFVNFLQNSFRIKDKELCLEVIFQQNFLFILITLY